MILPELFLNQMKVLLGEEYNEFLKSCEEPSSHGLRINRLKVDKTAWECGLNPFSISPVPWTTNGYYYNSEEQPAKAPYYYAGLYYLQEPSAMAPAALLPVEPGDKVLDLCAAPGGKSTELGAKLGGNGLLVANDISSSRAKALLKNLELSGIPNILVTSEAPEKLAGALGMYFDKILVDAPCSGEGMFRRDPSLIRSWEERGPEYYVPVQRGILFQAVAMLKPGGLLLYSTCTFSPLEDEDNISWLLGEYPELSLVPLLLFEGAAPGIGGEPVIRLFPHNIRGEGHFIALLAKAEGHAGQRLTPLQESTKPVLNRRDWEKLKRETDFYSFFSLVKKAFDQHRLMIRKDQIYFLPEGFSDHWKLRYLRTGLLLGELKNNRFQPSQALAMALKPDEFTVCFCLEAGDERVIRYLKGETIMLLPDEPDITGWCLVCIDRYPLGWAKGGGRSLKNKYYPGWRLQGGNTWASP